MIVVIFTVEKSLIEAKRAMHVPNASAVSKEGISPTHFCLLARAMLSKEKARELLRDVQFPGKLASLGYEYGLHF